MRKVGSGELRVGVPLPFSVFDDKERLLLAAGIVLDDEYQLQALSRRGLFTDQAADYRLRPVSTAPPPPRLKRSPIDEMTNVRRELVAALNSLNDNQDSFGGQLLAAATRLADVCRTDPEAALATIVHDREYRYSVRHLLDVAVVADIVAEGLAVPASERFSLICAAMTMNLAMLDLQDRLHAAAGVELTADDRQQIRAHPERSVATLMRLGVTDRKWLAFVLCHHEASDGSGYPKALVGEAIPLGARILSLADVYTARIEQRSDRAGLAPQASLREMFVRGGKGVDPLLAAMLVKKVGIYPPGTIVELQNGEIAIVTKRTDNASAPEVHSFMSKERMRYPKMLRKDTTQPAFKIKGAVNLDDMKIHFNPLQFWAQPA